jgi:hypothetical protein
MLAQLGYTCVEIPCTGWEFFIAAGCANASVEHVSFSHVFHGSPKISRPPEHRSRLSQGGKK